MSSDADGQSGLLLRLAGPLQSWGERSAFGERDTARHPTRSGLIGLFEAAQGRPRGSDLSRYQDVTLTVRIDRPGVRMVDFHTVGGGLPAARTVPTAAGKRRGEGATTIVSRRHYLTDAAFTVAVAGPAAFVDELGDALAAPVWAPYLGRRSCPPDAPMLLRVGVADPVSELWERTPLARRAPSTGDTVSIEFVYERLPSDEPDGGAYAELADIPLTFASASRAYHPRALWSRPRELPTVLCGGTDLLLAYLGGAA